MKEISECIKYFRSICIAWEVRTSSSVQGLCHFVIVDNNTSVPVLWSVLVCKAWRPHPVLTTAKEFENGVFALKTHQMFFVHTTLGKFENATITDYFCFVVEENSGREIALLSRCHRFWKATFSKCFRLAKHKVCVFEIPPVSRAS